MLSLCLFTSACPGSTVITCAVALDSARSKFSHLSDRGRATLLTYLNTGSYVMCVLCIRCGMVCYRTLPRKPTTSSANSRTDAWQWYVHLLINEHLLVVLHIYLMIMLSCCRGRLARCTDLIKLFCGISCGNVAFSTNIHILCFAACLCSCLQLAISGIATQAVLTGHSFPYLF